MLSDQAILAIMQVLTVNRDLHDLLQSKGVSPEHVMALCSQAMEANRPSIRIWAVRRRGQLWRDAQGAPRVFESKSAASHEAKDAAQGLRNAGFKPPEHQVLPAALVVLEEEGHGEED